jgi:hypothetical protein
VDYDQEGFNDVSGTRLMHFLISPANISTNFSDPLYRWHFQTPSRNQHSKDLIPKREFTMQTKVKLDESGSTYGAPGYFD